MRNNLPLQRRFRDFRVGVIDRADQTGIRESSQSAEWTSKSRLRVLTTYRTTFFYTPILTRSTGIHLWSERQLRSWSMPSRNVLRLAILEGNTGLRARRNRLKCVLRLFMDFLKLLRVSSNDSLKRKAHSQVVASQSSHPSEKRPWKVTSQV
jgi:hypothetical protein